MGQNTKLAEAGIDFAKFLAQVHTIGQMNNDIEDLAPGKKHEAESDILNRVTLFWKTLMDLPDEIVPTEKKDLKKVFEMARVFTQTTGRPTTIEDIPEIYQVITLGRIYIREIVRALYPIIQKLVYEPAKTHLNNGFTHVPVMDDVNNQYKQILTLGLEQEWKKFCRAGEIEENE